MRPSLPHFAKLCLFSALMILLPTLFAGSASAQATGFSTPPPNSVNITIQGCSGSGNKTVPVLPTNQNDYNSTLFVCPTADYTGGNLGPVWNELDLVPFRLTTTNKAGGGNVTYNVVVAGEYIKTSFVGWDEIGDATGNATTSAGPTENPNSASSCSATWNGFFITSDNSTIYRVLTVTQGDDTTCEWDYNMRLAIGSHLYPGSDLHGYEYQSADFKEGTESVPLPVNQIVAQSLAKNMGATQNSDHTWSITKTVTSPNGLDSCSTTQNTQPVTITINWQKMAATPDGPITVVTNINATNPADRDIYVAVTDKIYVGSGQTTLLGTATNVNNANPLNQSGTPTVVGTQYGVLVPAHSNNYAVLQDVQVDNTQSDSSYNDVASASYTDVATGVPIPQNTTATASSTVSPSGTTLDQTASIDELEGTRDSNDNFNLLNFSITGHTQSQGSGSYLNGYVEPDLAPLAACSIDQVVSGNLTQVSFPYCVEYNTGTLSSTTNATDSGSITFTKSLTSTKAGVVASGTLGDRAILTTTDTHTQLEAEATAAIAASASIPLTINKTVSNSATATFTFHVYDLNNCTGTPPAGCAEVFGNGNTSAPTISFAYAATNPVLTNSVTINLPPSNYDVTEDGLTGWQQITTNPQSANLSVVSGVAPCSGSVSFSNTQQGTIIVKKVTVPATDTTTQFAFTGAVTGSIANGGQLQATDLNPGTYHVTETQTTGWNLTHLSCSTSGNGGSVGSQDSGNTYEADITLNAGDTVTCTYTNTQEAHILVKKVTNPSSDTTTQFTFTPTYNSSTPFTLTNGQTPNDSGAIAPGTYHVTETKLAGWDLVGLSCSLTGGSDGSSGVQDGTNGYEADITLNAGDSLTCTYTNSKPDANISIGPATSTNPINQQHTFNITVTQIPNGDTPATSATITTSITPTGYSVVSDTCDGSPIAFSGTTATCAITINSTSPTTYTANASATLTIGTVALNRTTAPGGNAGPGGSGPATKIYQAGQIEVIKVTNPAGSSQSFSFSPGYESGFSLTGVSGSNSNTSGNLAPGSSSTYTVAETVPTGWNQLSATCSNGTPSAITVVAGSTTTCTFTNSKPDANITITPLTPVNPVNSPETFTITVTAIPNGSSPVIFGTITPTVTTTLTLTQNTNTCATPTVSGNTETCTVTVNSATPGTITVSASTTLTVGAVSLSRSTGDSNPGDSANGVKTYQAGQIQVVKLTMPAGSSQSFSFTPGYESGFSLTGVTGSNSNTSGSLAPGSSSTYNVAEVAPTGWNQVSATCTNGTPSAITVAAGATTVCTFTNSKPDANITITPLTPVNPVNSPETFTITATAILNGSSSAIFGAIMPTVSTTLTLTQNTNTCATPTVVSSTVRTCTVTVNSATPGTITVGASTTVTIGTVSLSRSTGDSNPGDGASGVKTYQAGQIEVIKVTNPASSLQTFTFTPNYEASGFALNGAGSNTNTSGYLAPGSTYTVSESEPAGWVPTSAVCSNGTPSGIVVTAGATTICTFTNTQQGKVQVIKTVNGSAPASTDPVFTFQIQSGATPITGTSPGSIGTVIDTLSTSAGNGTLNFGDYLVPGATYQMCEEMFPGYQSVFTINGTAAALFPIPDPNGTNPAWMCVNFSVNPGQTLTIDVNNIKPSTNAAASTIGFWKNWASCAKSNGGQLPVLDQTLFAAKGDTPEPYGPSIQIGALLLTDGGTKTNAGTACTYAVNLLNKTTINGKTKEASDPLFNLAAQLVGALLNIDSGAGALPNDSIAITEAEALLAKHNFNGNSYSPALTAAEATLANTLQTILNNYNNNQPPPATIPPYISSANTYTFTNGAAAAFTTMAIGVPTPTVTESGNLPAGFTFSAGTLSYSGATTPKASTTITFTATNSAGTFVQTFTIKAQ